MLINPTSVTKGVTLVSLQPAQWGPSTEGTEALKPDLITSDFVVVDVVGSVDGTKR